MVTAAGIPPVFILSTGRCGSTMVSDILNRHPDVLSLSEFFSFTSLAAFCRGRRTGEWLWRLLSQQQDRTRLMLQGDFEELLYPFGRPGARFTRANVPPILCAALPHLTDRHEELYDELGPVVRSFPAQRTSDQYRALFNWLCRRFDKAVWAERSGGSLLSAGILLRNFPEARIIHVYRDGRDVALSMSRHYLFRMIVASFHALRIGARDLLDLLPYDWLWTQLMIRLVPAISKFVKSRSLNYDRLELADFGKFWNRTIAHGFRVFGHFPHDSLLNVKFEDVQAEPEQQIRRIIRFIAPELENEDWIRAAASIPRPSPPRYTALDPVESGKLTEVCRPGLERLGYAV